MHPCLRAICLFVKNITIGSSYLDSQFGYVGRYTAKWIVKGSFKYNLHDIDDNKVHEALRRITDNMITAVMLYRDTEALDTSLGNTVSTFISCLANVIGSLLVVMFVTPAVLFAVIPLGILYRQVQVSHTPDPQTHSCNFNLKVTCHSCLAQEVIFLNWYFSSSGLILRWVSLLCLLIS